MKPDELGEGPAASSVLAGGDRNPKGETNVLGFRHHAKATDARCGHERAVARWDNIADAGKFDRVSNYYCPACDQFLAPDAVQAQAVPKAP